MQRENFIKYLNISTLTIGLLLLCTQSMAADVLSDAHHLAEMPITQELSTQVVNTQAVNIEEPLPTDATPVATVDVTRDGPITDALSGSASDSLKTIDEQADSSEAATAEVAFAPNSEHAATSASKPTSLKSAAYSQLVNLAFKGKGLNGVNTYTEAAAQFCRDARDKNDANAQFVLGWLYMNGRGVEKNADVAALFFAKAAQQGHTRAQIWLANSKGSPTLATAPACMAAPVAIAIKVNVPDAPEAQNSKPFYTKGPIYKLVSKIAPRYNIDTDLAMAFIAVESGFNPKATSPKNAQGLMQLIPETAARFNVKDAYNPEDNIKGGLAYLQWLLTYFQGDVQLVAAAYNSGENAVERYKGVPPYPETRKYVKKIAALYKNTRHPFKQQSGLGKKSSFVKVSG